MKVVGSSDSSGARGVAARLGLGKLKHIQTRWMWLQQEVREGRVCLGKEEPKTNPADLGTKYVAADDLHRLLRLLPLTFAKGCLERGLLHPIMVMAMFVMMKGEEQESFSLTVVERGWLHDAP